MNLDVVVPRPKPIWLINGLDWASVLWFEATSLLGSDDLFERSVGHYLMERFTGLQYEGPWYNSQESNEDLG